MDNKERTMVFAGTADAPSLTDVYDWCPTRKSFVLLRTETYMWVDPPQKVPQ